MDEEIIQAVYLRLRHSVQALALKAELQLNLYPDFVCKVDELALTFEQWYTWAIGDEQCGIVGNISQEITPAQKELLGLLNQRLTEMSGQNFADLWTDTALKTRKEWQQIRELAQKTLLSFHWFLEVPPSYGYEYIKSCI